MIFRCTLMVGRAFGLSFFFTLELETSAFKRESDCYNPLKTAAELRERLWQTGG
jgi:hypothetical protein